MTAFRAAFSDMKLVKTRQVAQLIFEIPIEEFDAAYEVLGGMPVPSKERWFGIAALKSPAEEARARPDQEIPHHTRPDRAAREKMDWRDMQPAAQCALRCNDATFRAFLTEEHSFRPRTGEDAAEQAAAFIRNWFGIKSRSELSTDHKKRVLWKQFDDSFSAWKALEHA
jgi:hypothetical protein